MAIERLKGPTRRGALGSLAVVLWLGGCERCERYESLQVQPAGALRTQYLVDFESRLDPDVGERIAGFLVVFNPSARPADLAVVAYFEDREPERFQLQARSGATTAFHASEWPVKLDGRFALEVQASQPVIVQGTLGWDDTAGNSGSGATTKSARGVREAASSYLAIPALADHWYPADGIVLNDHDHLWYRESE